MPPMAGIRVITAPGRLIDEDDVDNIQYFCRQK
jgi:hypothetical protein